MRSLQEVLERTAPECRDFATTIEALLEQRRQQSIWSKDWSRDEVCDLVYASYKALLRGVVRRVPRRAVVMQIADYFEASLQERNRLLVAAGYLPIEPYLSGPALEEALALGRQTLEMLPLPALLVTRDWGIQGVNQQLFALLGLSADQLQALPVRARNILHLVFDPGSPMYRLLGAGDLTWEAVARRDLQRFRRDNLFSSREPWFLELLNQLSNLPRFDGLWASVQSESPEAPSQEALHLIDFVNLPQGSLRVQMLRVGLGDLEFPRVLAYLPVD